ncbi:hypothetical protein [uncultured Roseivirga sp.]|uniref:hypothetical protein n=1 Tax=uncultured Roseivirga sp. TaxID=543088 RepID=UPI0030DB5E81|tara:strand:- start:3341 stop:3586 length:246 start_codon:yes stop_codon:yes gene_type:complete
MKNENIKKSILLVFLLSLGLLGSQKLDASCQVSGAPLNGKCRTMVYDLGTVVTIELVCTETLSGEEADCHKNLNEDEEIEG